MYKGPEQEERARRHGATNAWMYLSGHVASKGGAADAEASTVADSLADLIKGHRLEIERVDTHPCAASAA